MDERRGGGWRDAFERLAVHAVSHPALSRLAGRLSDARLPGPLLRALIRAYVRAYAVDLEDAADPLEAHRTFNDFFTRRLRPGARPVAAGPGVVVSPSDSRLQSFGRIPADGRLEQVKGRTYALADLLGSAEDAAGFSAGVHATLYLSPAMYHRVHAPVDGRLTALRYVPGRLFPVNALAVRHVAGLFAVNERVCVHLEAEGLGPVALVMVGAANVGRISLAFADLRTNTRRPAFFARLPRPIAVRRGDELGAFNLGSTVVLLASDPRLRPDGPGEGDLVRMGRALWRLP